MSSRAVGFEFLDLGFAVPELARDGGFRQFDPIIGAGKRLQSALEMNLPAAEFEVEVALAVVCGRRIL